MADRPLVYDVGMNHGLNVPYYLEKGYRVIAVEANTTLVRAAEERFAAEIEAGHLQILNVGVGAETGELPFYVNTVNDVRSTLVAPAELGDEWIETTVQVRPLSQLIAEHGEPEFLKIDVEHVDHLVLHDLLVSGIRPREISAEAHRVEVLCQLITMGYTRLQLVNCGELGRGGHPTRIRRLDGSKGEFTFERHSAGPFGVDLTGQWLDPEGILLQWAGRRSFLGRGWYDVHGRRR